jgi:acyl carrier protein
MNVQEIKSVIFKTLKKIAPETDPSELALDENIRESLNIDSFDALQFIVTIGDQLGIDIPEKDYNKTTTLKDLLSYIENHFQKEQNLPKK